MSMFECAICGTEYEEPQLEVDHFRPLTSYSYLATLPENLIALCSVCNASIANLATIPFNHTNTKVDWSNVAALDKEQVIELVTDIYKNTSYMLKEVPSLRSLLKWVEFVSADRTFENELAKARADIKSVRNEDELIQNVLVPIFDFLAFEGITVLHHSRVLEHGKDIVFYQRDNLSSFIFYAVVVCNTKIHTTSSKTGDSGHYNKIIDQVSKCYFEPWRDNNLKREAFIDKVIIATSSTIVDAAMTYFRRWEEKERRHLVFLDGERLAGLLVRLRLSK